MSDTKLVIHIGLHKTGTTWLQRRVFADERMGYLSLTPTGQSNEATDAFVTVDPLAFDPAAARHRFRPLLDGAQAKGLIPIISQERLSSDPSFGGYYFTDVVDRLVRTFGTFRVLLTIREQRGMLLALYRQAVRSGATHSLTQMIGTGTEPTGWAPTIRPEYLKYDRMIAHLSGRVGRENVCVLPLELMKSDAKDYLARLQAFTGANATAEPKMEPENAGLSPLATQISTFTNRFARPNPLGPGQSRRLKLLRSFYWQFDRVVPKSFSNSTNSAWKRTIESRVRGFYAESNRRTSELTGFDLGKMGYDSN